MRERHSNLKFNNRFAAKRQFYKQCCEVNASVHTYLRTKCYDLNNNYDIKSEK